MTDFTVDRAQYFDGISNITPTDKGRGTQNRVAIQGNRSPIMDTGAKKTESDLQGQDKSGK